ncbi:MAG: hypothetical protein ACPIOQ_17720, partial [Promethearchaeia archaeon]
MTSKAKDTKGKGKDKAAAAGSVLLPQVWARFTDVDSEKRTEDLGTVSKFVQEVHGQAGADGLYEALLQLQGLSFRSEAELDPQALCEVSFAVALGNEDVGLDKNRREALIKSIAQEIAGEPRQGHEATGKPEVEIDTKIPNSDVRIKGMHEAVSAGKPPVPEVHVEMVIVAKSKAHAERIVERMELLVEDNGKQRTWNAVIYRMVDELDRSDAREYDESKYLRFITQPAIRSCVTDFVNFSDKREPASATPPQPSIPQGRLPLRVLVVGGRDPYKNDLVKWLVGLGPQEKFRNKVMEKNHAFTAFVSSGCAEDWRSYRLSMRMGKLDAALRSALATNYSTLQV